MLANAMAAFIGCFAAMVTLAEVQVPHKVVRYVLALLIGVLVTYVLAFVVERGAAILARIS